MDLIWCSVVKTFSWAQVHHSNFSLYVVSRNFCNILALREILSKQAISILVRAPLPRLVRLRKIEWQAIQIFGHICMVGKFCAPVRRYRQGFGTKKQINHCPADGLSIFLVSLAATIFMFLLSLVLMLVEKSRWYFFSVLIATTIYLVKERIVRTRFIVIGVIVITFLMSYVGLYRMGRGTCDFIALTQPFFVEGDCGIYMILQIYDLVYSKSLKYCIFFADYFIDPVIYMVPRIVFVFLGLEKDSSTLFAKFVADHQAFLAEPYAPGGGFHYIAQASSTLPFIGPIIVTYCFARICVYFENNSTNGLKGKFYYYIFTAGFCFVFIKTQFHQTIKYGLTLFLPAFLIFKGVQYLNQRSKIE